MVNWTTASLVNSNKMMPADQDWNVFDKVLLSAIHSLSENSQIIIEEAEDWCREEMFSAAHQERRPRIGELEDSEDAWLEIVRDGESSQEERDLAWIGLGFISARRAKAVRREIAQALREDFTALSESRSIFLGGGRQTDGSGAERKRLKKLAAVVQAIELRMQHPDWSMDRIAKAVGMTRQTLGRHSMYARALKAIHADPRDAIPPGFLTREGGIVGISGAQPGDEAISAEI